MLRRDIKELAVYQIEENVDYISFDHLRGLYVNKTSEIIYITKEKKLYGIVCMGEVLHGHKKDATVKINKSYTSLSGYNIVKAREIFLNNIRINKIPVITEQGELIGEYSRWDDWLYIQRNSWIIQEETIRNILSPYTAVYVVKPSINKLSIYLHLTNLLDYFHIFFTVLNQEQIVDKLSENVICIFVDEDERRGTQCLYGIEPCVWDSYQRNISHYDVLWNKQYKIRLTTYKNLLLQHMEDMQLRQLHIQDCEHRRFDRLDVKAAVMVFQLIKKGIQTFVFYTNEDEITDYGRKFQEEVHERLRLHPWDLNIPWSKAMGNEEFYGDLYQQKDYKEGVAQKELFYADAGMGYKKSLSGKYFNIKDGRRATCYQPKKYIGTIYLVGFCTVVGGYVEDQYTLASCLQKRLIEKGYPYRVENYGLEMQFNTEERLDEIEIYCANDLVIYQSRKGRVPSVQGESLEKIFEVNGISSGWVINSYDHCNHQANQIIADRWMEMIEPYLKKKEIGNEKRKIAIDFQKVMGDYVQWSYLQYYFTDFLCNKYNTVGSIVMKADPFHMGHWFLIQQACLQTEFLIVFLINEDTFLFSFEERFKMVTEGIKDLENVLVVPSGDFVLSRENFYEYYTHRYDIRTVINARYDIDVFAEYIARPLHITHRFAGEGVQGRISKVYYENMRKILPQKGIDFVEIPRLEIDGVVVRTKQIQKYLEYEEYDKVFTLVPESTKQYLIEQLALEEG